MYVGERKRERKKESENRDQERKWNLTDVMTCDCIWSEEDCSAIQQFSDDSRGRRTVDK